MGTSAIQRVHEQFVYPIVRVVSQGKGGAVGGSGIVVYSKPKSPKSKEYETYLLTNHHVIEGAINVSKKWNAALGADVKEETRSEVMAEFFGYEDLSRLVEAAATRADVVAWDAQRDLGLLQLKTKTKVDHVAPIMTPEKAKKSLFLTTPVYTVGCGLGVPPLVTEGHIGGFDFQIDNYPYNLTTAPSIYGNSGGAVFSKESGEVIGVTARISVVLAGFGTAPVTHMSFSIAPETIYDFLGEQMFDFIVDPKRTSAQCAKEREQMKKKALEGLLRKGPDSDEEEAQALYDAAP